HHLECFHQGHHDHRPRRNRIRCSEDPSTRGEDLSMARNDIRTIIKLKSTAGSGYTYVTRKNKRNNPDRTSLMNFDPVVRKHVEFRAERYSTAKKSTAA